MVKTKTKVNNSCDFIQSLTSEYFAMKFSVFVVSVLSFLNHGYKDQSFRSVPVETFKSKGNSHLRHLILPKTNIIIVPE